MFEQDTYRIPKLKKEVQVKLNDGAKTLQTFTFFFNEFSKYSKEQQTILEFLNDESVLIPANQIQSNKQEAFVIINKNEICYIFDPTIHPAPSAAMQKEFLFLLKSGESIKASIYEETPKEQSRMIDYLSNAGKFVELVMDGKSFIYLNKNFILKVIS